MIAINNCEQNKFLPRVAGVTLTLIVITSSPHCGGYSTLLFKKDTKRWLACIFLPRLGGGYSSSEVKTMLKYPQEYLDDVITRFAYHSNRIEGNKLTRGQTRAIVLNETVTVTGYKGVSLKDVYEADNQKSAFNHMLHLAANNAPLSIDTILSLQFDLTKNTLSTSGKFKTNDNFITGSDFKTAPKQLTPIEVKQWAENTEYQLNHTKTNDEYLKTLIDSHIQFERIHPFDDGNGRTGRDLINLKLMENEMPLLVIDSQDKSFYLTTLADRNTDALFAYAKDKLKNENARYQSFVNNIHLKFDGLDDNSKQL